jgi:hypothetical protein
MWIECGIDRASIIIKGLTELAVDVGLAEDHIAVNQQVQAMANPKNAF